MTLSNQLCVVAQSFKHCRSVHVHVMRVWRMQRQHLCKVHCLISYDYDDGLVWETFTFFSVMLGWLVRYNANWIMILRFELSEAKHFTRSVNPIIICYRHERQFVLQLPYIVVGSESESEIVRQLRQKIFHQFVEITWFKRSNRPNILNL